MRLSCDTDDLDAEHYLVGATAARCTTCGTAAEEVLPCAGGADRVCRCPAGTYKDATGSWDTPCIDCAACDAGEYRQGCGLASAGSCVACPDGMYKTDSHSGLCVDCQPCVAGAYLPQSTA